MTEALLKEKFDDLKLTEDEVKRFSEAMKKDEFRKLLVDYANEISDPKNRKLYEEEIEKLENERGVDVTFINPEPGFVLKSVQDGEKKCFINICTNTNINKPSSEITTRYEENSGVEKKGMTWSIPHSVSPPREDLDKTSKKCMVYDVVFHPDSYRMAETNKRFKQLLQDTAIDSIERNFKVKIDRNNSKILNIKFKGVPTATVIRRAKESEVKANEPQDDLFNKVKTPYQYPPSPETQTVPPQAPSVVVDDEYEEPKYKIIDRGHVDIQDCVNQLKQVVNSTRPKELIVEIDLPLCKSTSNVKLDIFERRLYLESNKPNYKLDLNLAYPVSEEDGNAKFDKSKRKLVVTLPVKQSNVIEIEGSNLIEPVLVDDDEMKEESQTPVQQLVEKQKEEEEETIKYCLPSQYKFEQNTNDLKLKFYIKNFVEKSFSISTSAQYLTIKYETVSNGGYVTYYSVYLDFNNQFIDLNTNYKLEHENVHSFDEFVLIKFKKMTNIHLEKVYLSLNSKNDQEKIEVHIEPCEEEELKDELNKISSECNNSTSNVSFKIGSNTNDRFSINLLTNDENELDEDDDPSPPMVVKNEENTAIESNNRMSESSNDSLDDSGSQSSLKRQLKGILKKSRSVSEGESNHESDSLSSSYSRSTSGTTSAENSLETISEREHRKSVSFNQKIVQNVFKSNSSILDMKKPHTSKNKKRNQRRKRTNSDPSHSNDSKDKNSRIRSTSESSEDGLMGGSHERLTASSEDDIHQGEELDLKEGEEEDDQEDEIIESVNEKETVRPSTLNEETMLSWKTSNSATTNFTEKTKCAFKFTNKIMNELDD